MNISDPMMFNKIDGYLDTRLSPSYVRYIIRRGKQMKYKNKIIKGSQEIDYHWILKNLDEKWFKIHVNEGQNLSYWKLINNKEQVVIVPQTGSIPSPINHERSIYVYTINYYTI